MSKFLRLLRESDPARTSKFTIELKDYNGDVLDAIESSGDSYEAFKGVKELFGIDDDIPGDVGEGSVEYIHGEPGSEEPVVDGVEDNEVGYETDPKKLDLETGVRNLAKKAKSGLGRIGSAARKAKRSVERRDKAYNAALPVFNQRTKEIEQVIKELS